MPVVRTICSTVLYNVLVVTDYVENVIRHSKLGNNRYHAVIHIMHDQSIGIVNNNNFMLVVYSKKLNNIMTCPKCGEEISLDDCFKDKAAENELKSATIKCANQNCPWEGPSKFYKVCMLIQIL